MSPIARKEPAFVICVNNADYPASLELRKLYLVIPDDEAKADQMLRIVDESGEDYLYPADYFIAVDLPSHVREALAQLDARPAA